MKNSEIISNFIISKIKEKSQKTEEGMNIFKPSDFFLLKKPDESQIDYFLIGKCNRQLFFEKNEFEPNLDLINNLDSFYQRYDLRKKLEEYWGKQMKISSIDVIKTTPVDKTIKIKEEQYKVHLRSFFVIKKQFILIAKDYYKTQANISKYQKGPLYEHVLETAVIAYLTKKQIILKYSPFINYDNDATFTFVIKVENNKVLVDGKDWHIDIKQMFTNMAMLNKEINEKKLPTKIIRNWKSHEFDYLLKNDIVFKSTYKELKEKGEILNFKCKHCLYAYFCLKQ